MNNDSLGDRMKRYEHAFRYVLPARQPIVVRVDGKAFHSVLAHADRPFDLGVVDDMNNVAIELCRDLQGAQIAYVQSDEVSVLVHSYKRHQSQPTFDGEVQKIASISAALAAGQFSLTRNHLCAFDGRVFVLPESDVCNYFIWRQQDATRNSIQMAARAVFSHRKCDRKNTSELQEMLFQEKGINWNDYATGLKRGRCIVRESYQFLGAERHRWVVDADPPIFTKDRSYIEKWLATEPETGPTRESEVAHAVE